MRHRERDPQELPAGSDGRAGQVLRGLHVRHVPREKRKARRALGRRGHQPSRPREIAPMRVAALAGVIALGALAGQLPLKQNVEILKEAPMRADKVKEGLYVIRGPFLPCMTGCRPGQTGDGLIHESGDVAVRVTPEGLIVVDDKFASQAADVLARVESISSLPIKYLLNSHH